MPYIRTTLRLARELGHQLQPLYGGSDTKTPHAYRCMCCGEIFIQTRGNQGREVPDPCPGTQGLQPDQELVF